MVAEKVSSLSGRFNEELIFILPAPRLSSRMTRGGIVELLGSASGFVCRAACIRTSASSSMILAFSSSSWLTLKISSPILRALTLVSSSFSLSLISTWSLSISVSLTLVMRDRTCPSRSLSLSLFFFFFFVSFSASSELCKAVICRSFSTSCSASAMTFSCAFVFVFSSPVSFACSCATFAFSPSKLSSSASILAEALTCSPVVVDISAAAPLQFPPPGCAL
mmetsp:Transcript_23498/g.76523  ORF Transcript_23498/g.76523 Transcript_23498/m.76523 type:complete len:222 (+) Transcript_23498:62-727(+)